MNSALCMLEVATVRQRNSEKSVRTPDTIEMISRQRFPSDFENTGFEHLEDNLLFERENLVEHDSLKP